MCGIVGFVGAKGCPTAETMRAVGEAMTARLVHRGPDDAGCWLDAGAEVFLGHRRLAVLDLSPAGRQPMVSACGRYVLNYNGEIYNFAELKKELSRDDGAIPWRGQSDTEVLLEALARWGCEETLKRLNGMFAFALWDRREKTLFLARDRFGEKPLYYGEFKGVFLFASELKAFRHHPVFEGKVDRDAVTQYLRFGYVPCPKSIFHGIGKLPPGSFLRWRQGQPGPLFQRYWCATRECETNRRKPFAGADEEAIEHLAGLLRESIRLRMVADVPVGVFLSGGIDSSTVAALMQTQSARPVQTFTIGFQEMAFDEAMHARKVAGYLGTEHHELVVTAEEAMRVIPRLPTLYDEPFADSSQIPTFLVSRLARQRVTVSLSGDGGDELFCGYDRYQLGRMLWNLSRHVPLPLRRGIAGGMHGMARMIRMSAAREGFISPFFRKHLAGVFRKLEGGAGVLDSRGKGGLMRFLVSHWKHPLLLTGTREEPGTVFDEKGVNEWNGDFRELMMAVDAMTYLPDDLLVKVDRASMGVSLEVRAPFLEQRVAEFAWSLPMPMKVRGGTGKWILRGVLDRYVPRELVDRPKMGFAIPLGEWLRGPLRAWAEALLSGQQLETEGLLHAALIRRVWREHLEGYCSWHSCLWDILMLQAWLEDWRRDAGK
ncbi:MAG: asparagine synthase (glutamine-hydrolyzing) [Verrucomicrobiae bacterium]|nr:asparagine synthase (glutamine-hydrolyzing) [Verrucomicrobiae bacterium]